MFSPKLNVPLRFLQKCKISHSQGQKKKKKSGFCGGGFKKLVKLKVDKNLGKICNKKVNN